MKKFNATRHEIADCHRYDKYFPITTIPIYVHVHVHIHVWGFNFNK